MPAASVFFHDPDGHLPEYLAMPAYELALDEAAFHRTAFKPASLATRACLQSGCACGA
jgi:hypothetical protein